jgi:hypothetical protein
VAIGEIKSVRVVDGQVTAVIQTGAGPAVTATVLMPAGLDFQPLAGDTVKFHRSGQEIVVTGLFTEDTQAGPGEAILFSRADDGDIVATIWMKASGAIEITPGDGQVAGVGNGTHPVALATPIDTFLNALVAAVAPGGTPILTPSPGATCPVAASVYAAMGVAWPPPGTAAACGSTNLKAD